MVSFSIKCEQRLEDDFGLPHPPPFPDLVLAMAQLRIPFRQVQVTER